MSCAVCEERLGIRRQHGAGRCPVRGALWCSQCGCYGHTATECVRVTHVWRPRTLEELIPEDVRQRWGITTQTHIIWPSTLTLEDKEREIADNNRIEIRYTTRTRDAAIRAYMRNHDIPTDKRMTDNLICLREWAVARGKKLVLIQE